MLSQKEIVTQSNAAFAIWKDTWASHAKRHAQIRAERGNPTQSELVSVGRGRQLLCCGYGPSFEEQIEILLKYKNKLNKEIDVACVDKAFGTLCDHGIIPKYVMLADARTSLDWIGKHEEKTRESTLLINMGGNPEWAEKWKGKIYWYINKDSIQSEEMFFKITGYNEVIPAASNVGNALIVFATQILGYDKYVLLGYDYSWGDTNYYAFNNNNKRYFLKDAEAIDNYGNYISTSNNLYFSARWLNDFCRSIANMIDIVDCSSRGFLEMPQRSLNKMLELATVRNITTEEKNIINQSRARVTKFAPNEGEKLSAYLKNNQIFEIVCRGIPNSEVLK